MGLKLLRVPKPDSYEDLATRVEGATKLTPMGREALADIARAFVQATDGNYEEMLSHAEGFLLNLQGDPNFNIETNTACKTAKETVDLMRRVVSNRGREFEI